MNSLNRRNLVVSSHMNILRSRDKLTQIFMRIELRLIMLSSITLSHYLDVDECKQQGGSDGHHCNANTRCVNVVGSYTCECLPGYHRVDKFNCAELDECATGHHQCDEHATCVNTAGSYYCICKDGYTGDGYTCKRTVSSFTSR